MASSKAKSAVAGEKLPFDFGVDKLGTARKTAQLVELLYHDSSFSK